MAVKHCMVYPRNFGRQYALMQIYLWRINYGSIHSNGLPRL